MTLAECRYCRRTLEKLNGFFGPVWIRSTHDMNVDRVECDGEDAPNRKHVPEQSATP